MAMPSIMRMVEVLPAPFGPSIPKMPPDGMFIDKSSTATNWSYILRTRLSSTVFMGNPAFYSAERRLATEAQVFFPRLRRGVLRLGCLCGRGGGDAVASRLLGGVERAVGGLDQ